MKKRAILRTVVLCALIFLIFLAMNSKYSFQRRHTVDIEAALNGDESAYTYFPESLSIDYSQSVFLVLLSLFLSVSSVGYRIFGRICGDLLLLSSALILYPCRFRFFTPLTWGIVAALILVGLWAIFAFRKKPQAQSAEASAETANAMKKRAILRTAVLCALIFLIILAMTSKHSYQECRVGDIVAAANGDESVYTYFPAPLFTAGPSYRQSFFWVKLSLFLSVSSVGYRIFGRICGVLLLLSSALILYDHDFGVFTPLTWGIVAALILVGLWAIFAFRKKPQAQSAEASAETAN